VRRCQSPAAELFGSAAELRSAAAVKMGKRRGIRRQKSFLRGFVYFNTRRGVTSCLVRDMSGDGARIILSMTVAIPDVINIHIPRASRHCAPA
jgi:hypothetical protein